MKPLLPLAILLLAACQAAPREPVTLSNAGASPAALVTPAPAESTVLRIRASGGMCPDGVCGTETVLRLDGRFTRTVGKNPPTQGRIDAALAAAVAKETAQANFTQLTARPFTGLCPTAYDGSEFFYTFPTAQGDQAIGSCKVDIDWQHPLFAAVKRVEEALNQQ
ncbi:MAG: hypothetical protein ACK46X_06465 [Candidatus Sericytochromatia bacterium]